MLNPCSVSYIPIRVFRICCAASGSRMANQVVCVDPLSPSAKSETDPVLPCGGTGSKLRPAKGGEGICLKCNCLYHQPTVRMREIVLPCNSPRRELFAPALTGWLSFQNYAIQQRVSPSSSRDSSRWRCSYLCPLPPFPASCSIKYCAPRTRRPQA